MLIFFIYFIYLFFMHKKFKDRKILSFLIYGFKNFAMGKKRKLKEEKVETQ